MYVESSFNCNPFSLSMGVLIASILRLLLALNSLVRYRERISRRQLVTSGSVSDTYRNYIGLDTSGFIAVC